jgi:pectin methylesterase-like acyl-CoA thioesterase
MLPEKDLKYFREHFRRIILFTMICIGICSISAEAQNVGDFRTHSTSGNWNDPSMWERWDGSTWVNPAPSTPDSSAGVVTVLSGDSVIVNVNTIVDQTVVQAGAAVTIGVGDTLTVANGADSIDCIVNGNLYDYGFIVASGRISFENGAWLFHRGAAGAGSIPNSTWRTGSTCQIDSSSGSNPSNINTQTFYNFIWNATNQGANGGPNFGDGAVINGDFTILSSKGLQFRLANLTGGQTKTVYINGNVNVSGSTSLLTGTGSGADTAAKVIVVIGKNVNVSAGQWSLDNSSSAYAEWRVKGNVNITGGTMQSGTSGWYGRRTLNFVGGTTQTFTVASPGTIGSAGTLFKVSNGSTVQMNFPFTLPANDVIGLGGGTFVTSSTNLITLPSPAAIVGGSDTSFVNGPLAMNLSAATGTLNFPIGKGTAFRPVILTLNQDAATSTTYTAEMFNAAPTTRTLPATLTSISSVRYYHITKGTGANLSPTLGGTIQLSYGADDLVSDSSLVRVTEDSSGVKWLNLGGSGTANNVGTITSNAFYSLTSNDFVLATANPSASVLLPTVSTAAVTRISTTIATTGGNVTNDGGGAVSDRGVCWNTTGSPTVSDSKLSAGSGTGIFKSSLTGLTAGQTYHLRAYATNSAGTAYGNEMVFSTLAAIVPPSVTTASVSNIQVTTAIGGGTVTDWGGDSVLAKGVCWNTTGTPTISGSHTVDGSDTGSYSSGLAPLVGNTLYHVRAYATNSAGTGYGNEVTFTSATAQRDTTVTVAKDGSGNYTTVQAAFNAVPSNYTGHWTIYVKNGTYHEKDTLVSGKINVILQGQNRDSTIISYDDYADKYGGNGSGNPGTSGSFTIAIDASDFTARDITFQNTYSPQAGVTGTQAVALRSNGDRQTFINCKLLGFQDTYYTWGGSGAGRLYLKNCFIEGTVDFIFGRDIAVFDSCTIHEIRNGGTLTAGSTDPSSSFGYVFRNCTILADSIGYDGNVDAAFYLGRPWQSSPRTVFMHCYEPRNLSPAGWLSWNVTPALYAEYDCYGPGAVDTGRVAWSSQLSDSLATTYSLSNIFARKSASSSLILYDWMPPGVTAADNLPFVFDTSFSVQVTSFTANVQSHGVVLNWQTVNEVNNAGFNILRKGPHDATFSLIASYTNVPALVGLGVSNIGKAYSYTDTSVHVNGVYSYQLKSISSKGVALIIDQTNVTGVRATGNIPKRFELFQNFPNPFNPTTTITYDLPQASRVSIDVFDVLGSKVATIASGDKHAGEYTAIFDGTKFASGVYFYRITAVAATGNSYNAVRKFVLLK